jgi:hypothetical protein
MKMERDGDGSLRLWQSNGVWRVLLLFMAGGAIGSWLTDSFPTEDWRGQVGLALAVGAPVLFALWLQDSAWTFDRARRLVTWTRSRLAVRGVAIQRGTNYKDYLKEPHVYRVMLAARAATSRSVRATATVRRPSGWPRRCARPSPDQRAGCGRRSDEDW